MKATTQVFDYTGNKRMYFVQLQDLAQQWAEGQSTPSGEPSIMRDIRENPYSWASYPDSDTAYFLGVRERFPVDLKGAT